MLLVGSGSQQERGRPGLGGRTGGGQDGGRGGCRGSWIPGHGSDAGGQRLRGSWQVPVDRCGSVGSVSTGKG